MKPTVIPTGNINSGSNSERINNNMNVPTGNVSHDPNNNPATGGNSQANNSRRQFPNYQQGFGFDPDIDDIFSDTGIRSRMPGRMRDPFTSFGSRKSCGYENFTDPYSRYFEDDTDNFFPGFGHMGSGRRNRANPQTQNTGDDGFFSSFPDEFRQYIPEGFGFGRRGGSTRPTVGSPQATNMSEPPQQYYQQPPQQQYYQQPVYQQPGQYDNVPYYEQGAVPVPQSPKPQLCDAAIQTEDLAAESKDIFPTGTPPKLKQHGLRNTVDMGQKSAQEEESRGPRSHSAPPNNKDGQCGNKSQQQSDQSSGNEPVYVSSATFKTSAPKKIPTPVKAQGSQQQSYYTPSPPNPPQRHSSIPHHQQPPPQTPTTPGGSYIRTVPIFVEGRQSPVINSHKEIPNQYQQQQSGRPTINTAKANKSDELNETIPPQTPHTTDCINKITDIQRDVLDLMSKVENFKGQKNDKEYMYLDEMLTRNLLKLDTIDTNGKESIRLARKEAIKCIQASINVLEAKSNENAKAAANIDNINESLNELNVHPSDDTSSDSKPIIEENPNVLSEQIVIPLPPPPQHEPEPKVIEENPNILDEQTVIALPPPPQTNPEQTVTESQVKEAIKNIEPHEEEGDNISKLDKNIAEDDLVGKGDNKVKESSPSKEGAKKKIIKKLKKIAKKETSPSASESKIEE